MRTVYVVECVEQKTSQITWRIRPREID